MKKMLYSVKEMGISIQESSQLPQMKKMKTNKAPSKKEIMNFMKK